MSGRGDSLALAVVLLYGMTSDGLMELCGPVGFIQVSALILGAAVALHLIRKEERA